MRIIATALLILLMLELTQAEPRQSKERHHNYILRRQEAGLVSGVPTIRRIIGKREMTATWCQNDKNHSQRRNRENDD